MPQYDLYHDTVKNALVKDGWIITDDPFLIAYKGVRLYADLGAEKLLAAEKPEHKIVVEIMYVSHIRAHWTRRYQVTGSNELSLCSTIPITKRRYYGRVQHGVHDFLAMGPELVKADMTGDKVQFFFDVNGVVVVAARRQDNKYRFNYGASIVCILSDYPHMSPECHTFR